MHLEDRVALVKENKLTVSLGMGYLLQIRLVPAGTDPFAKKDGEPNSVSFLGTATGFILFDTL